MTFDARQRGPSSTGEDGNDGRAAETAKALCEHHSGPLYQLAWLTLGDPELAETAVVDTLAAAGARCADSSRTQRPALAADTMRCCQHLREQAHRTARSSGRPVGRPSSARHGGDAARRRHHMLNSLSDDQRAVLALTVFGDHSCDRAARTLGISSERATALLEDALTRLRTNPNWAPLTSV